RPHRAKSAVALGGVPELSLAVFCDTHWLVHGRGRPSTLDGLWRSADSRCNDAVPDNPHSGILTGRLLPRLQLHFRVWNGLHLPAPARGPDWASDSPSRCRNSEPTHVGCRRAPSGFGHTSRRGYTSSRCRRIAMVMFWVAILAISILL